MTVLNLHCYVHIPFCRTRCPYCDFFLVTRQDIQERFFRALHKETILRTAPFRGRKVKTLHFGGGTPSLVSSAYLEGWLETLGKQLSLEGTPEITLEANPEDLTPVTCREFVSLGINRLSLGVQSFSPEKLSVLGRKHTRDEAFGAVAVALEYFGNVSVDLICGVEGESLEVWEQDLQAVLATGVPHVSIYMLSVEKKTRLESLVRRGMVSLPDEQDQAAMYLKACELLEEKGFLHYEVSNFSKPGFFSLYNLGCWHRESYLGFGPSAHSFIVSSGKEIRSANVNSMLRYIASGGDAVVSSEIILEKERNDERIFLGLRLSSGLSLDELACYHRDSSFPDETLDRLREQGLVVLQDGVLALTRKGFLFADKVAEELMPS